jgi:hypothetical protein
MADLPLHCERGCLQDDAGTLAAQIRQVAAQCDDMTKFGAGALRKMFFQHIVKNMAKLRQKRLLLALLTACLVFAAVFSEGFVLANLNHVHTGEHCSLCLQIEIAQKLLEGLGRIGLFALAACLAPESSVLKNLLCFSFAPQTLVAQKIKNNS